MSRYGASRGCPEYDKFRTGLSYRTARQLVSGRQYRRRGTVLGAWHQLKKELFYSVTGILLALVLGPGCGSVEIVAQDAGGVDSWQGEASNSGDRPGDAPSSPDLASPNEDSRVGDASPTTCVWAAMPHAVEHCPGAGLSCHYLDSVGRPDGWLTHCQVDGEECVYPCQ